MPTEGTPDPFQIENRMPEEGKKVFLEKIEELKEKGFLSTRVIWQGIDRDEKLSDALGSVPLNEGEEIAATYRDNDDMQDAGDAEKPADILYVLVGKK